MTIFGPDGARYQEGIRLEERDWDAVGFAAWRAIHQNGAPDRTFKPMAVRFADEHKPFAAYVWVDSMPGATKAGYAAAAIGDTSIPIMVDWEDRSCSFQNMMKFVTSMRGRGYRVTLLYTGRYFHATMGNPDLRDLGMDLVIARYGDQADNGTYEMAARYAYMVDRYSVWDWTVGGIKPSMWQFGSRIRWGDRYMDMNAIRDPAVIARCFTDWAAPTPTPEPPDEDNMTYAELKNLWVAPSATDVGDGGESDRWLHAIILKVGSIADVQSRNQIPVTGRYDQATATAYAKELAAMKVAAGA